jgi:long-chain acyl-CoA synthetase
VVHGDGRNYVVALVTLDEEALHGWAEKQGLGDLSYEQVTRHDRTREMVQGYIDELNDRLNKWETIKRFQILPRDLTIEDGDLTPSLKVKRKAVERKHAAVLDSMYAE